MRQPLPLFPPLYAPLGWWQLLTEELLGGSSRSEAVKRANMRSGIPSRDWLRFSLAGDSGLSLPLKGGASSLKNHPPQSWVAAKESGRESRKIAATVATIYGRAPFYAPLAHLVRPFPGLSAGNCDPTGIKISDICTFYYEETAEMLNLNDANLLQTLRKAINEQDKIIKSEKHRLSEKTDPSLSILDAVMRFGPDAIFTLLPTF